jgi:hypothetical protein
LATLLNPNGGEELFSDHTYTVNWSIANPAAVKFHLRYFDGFSWNLIDVNVPGTSYDWTVPTVGVRTTGYRFKISAYDVSNNLLGEEESDSTFAINPPLATLINPNGDEELISNDSYVVNWSIEDPAAVKFHLRYFNGTVWNLITTDVPGTSYNWTVPIVGERMTGYRFKISAYDIFGNLLGEVVSNKPFAVNP